MLRVGQELETAKNRSLVDVALAYGRAKSEQDLVRAAAFVRADFDLCMPSVGARSRGRVGFHEAMRRLYVSFPDYRFVPESVVGDDAAVVMTGRVHATFSGYADAPGTRGLGILRALGLLRPRAVDVAAVASFIGTDGLLVHETFHVDGIELAEAIGVPSWVVGRMRRAGLAAGVIS